jgi:hypothetical protein
MIHERAYSLQTLVGVEDHLLTAMSLRSILGGSRIKKKKPSTPRSSTTGSSSWTGRQGGSSVRRQGQAATGADDDKEQNYLDDFEDGGKLPDHGLVLALANDASLRDVPQAIRYAQTHMFEVIPESHSGMGSTRIAAVLRYRAALPPVATSAHVQAVLSAAGPTAVERETAELLRAGVLRRIVVPRREGGVGEALIMTDDLVRLVRDAEVALDATTKDGFVRFLEENPVVVKVPRVVVTEKTVDGKADKRVLLSHRQTDQLVRAGFLTAQHSGPDVGGTAFSRPEDRSSLISVENISQAASGSMAAVGGTGVLHAAGGSGIGGGGDLILRTGDLSLSVPGHGTFLKLVSGALAHLASLLERLQYREAPESLLRERWDGGIARDDAAMAKRARGEFVGIVPGRTRKWKDFYGMSFDWILQEAVGTGLVEVFETRSVGSGIRLV